MSRIKLVESFRYDGKDGRQGAKMESTKREAGVVKYLVLAMIGLPTSGYFRKDLEICWRVIVSELEYVS